jgi:hypothetical protein
MTRDELRKLVTNILSDYRDQLESYGDSPYNDTKLYVDRILTLFKGWKSPEEWQEEDNHDTC